MDVRARLRQARRIVVKVGSSTLTHEMGALDLRRIDHLLREIVDLMNEGKEIILVSSGAIAAGMGRLGLREKPQEIAKKQALAAIGQGILMHIYEKFFAEYGRTMGQVLLTKENAAQHKQYHNSRAALLAMLEMGTVPVVNENDVVSVDEIKIGDNDNLSAVVAALVDADALIILTDIEGLYTANPAAHPEAKLIDIVEEVTPDVISRAGGAGTKCGTGGMMTKIEAAQIAMSAGTTMVIAAGAREEVLHTVLAGKRIGTIFPAKAQHLHVRKNWLAFGRRLRGDILVDAGCVDALKHGSSLLAAGITAVEGEFLAGDTVRVLDAAGCEIARGIAAMDADVAQRVRGHRTENFSAFVEGSIPDEVIHRDNLVLMV